MTPEQAAKSGWISVAAAARLLSKSERHVWRMVASGALPSTLVDGRRLIARRVIDAAKKPLTCQWECQTDSIYTAVVEAILNRLRPVVEQTVREQLEGKNG